MIIQSGDHNAFGAKVNSKGELFTHATASSKLYIEGEEGNSFYLVTNFLTITTPNTEHGMLHIRNDSGDVLHIAQIRTCGTAVQKWRIIKNATTGTLIDTGSADLIPENLHFGSGKSFNGLNRVGGEGFTVTNGKHLTQWINPGPGHSETDVEGAISINGGSSITIMCDLAAAGDACVSILAFYD